MIQSRRRRRHSPTELAPTKSGGVRKLFITVLLLVLLVWALRALYIRISPLSPQSQAATVLRTEGKGGVFVTIGDEEAERRAESGLRLYDGDRVRTEGTIASFDFFDGSQAVLDRSSLLTIQEMAMGNEMSFLALELLEGTLWVRVGTGTTVHRTVDTPLARFTIPPRTEGIFERNGEEERESMHIRETTGQGVEASIRRTGRPAATVITGEGQELQFSKDDADRIRDGLLDPYDLRGVLDENAFQSDFIQEVREREERPEEQAEAVEDVEGGEQLTVLSPQDGSLLSGDSVLVSGSIGSRVETVRVNGYVAMLKENSFEKEIALPASEEFMVEVQAEDKEGLIVDTKTLALSRDIKPPAPPVITAPGGSGDTVRVSDDVFEIIGNASSDTAGIAVNGYRLQKFLPGQPWHYLVDPAIGNVRVGENIYDVVALDRSGNSSVPVRITIVWKAQVVVPPAAGNDSLRDKESYVEPGSLRIIAPADGSPHVTSASEVLIEGVTSPKTHAMSVNGFTLTKYELGKTTWNYIARDAFGNYRKGVNLYTIVARNASGEILDVLRFTIERR